MWQGFSWDPVKAESNIKDHGVRFEEAATVFDDPLWRWRRCACSGEKGVLRWKSPPGDRAIPLFQRNFRGLCSKKRGFRCKCIDRNTGVWEVLNKEGRSAPKNTKKSRRCRVMSRVLLCFGQTCYAFSIVRSAPCRHQRRFRCRSRRWSRWRREIEPSLQSPPGVPVPCEEFLTGSAPSPLQEDS
jgi:hypothetical protein